mmetsp:Transcript_37500/g.55837  ORF Transcript_37500/g.55837 Transcript_37500/m.55837 type:complete len:203 (+) Transcript_37500:479-1087(+)
MARSLPIWSDASMIRLRTNQMTMRKSNSLPVAPQRLVSWISLALKVLLPTRLNNSASIIATKPCNNNLMPFVSRMNKKNTNEKGFNGPLYNLSKTRMSWNLWKAKQEAAQACCVCWTTTAELLEQPTSRFVRTFIANLRVTHDFWQIDRKWPLYNFKYCIMRDRWNIRPLGLSKRIGMNCPNSPWNSCWDRRTDLSCTWRRC